MNARVAIVLVVLLAVLGGGALLYSYQERTRRPENVATLGRPLLKDLKVADVATIKITEPKSTLTIQRKDDGWVIAERRGFPADVAKVREFALKLIGLKVGQSEPIGDKDRARLNLLRGGRHGQRRHGHQRAGARVQEPHGDDPHRLATLKLCRRNPKCHDSSPAPVFSALLSKFGDFFHMT